MPFFILYPGNNWQFSFNVKFYPPDPSLLTEDITRYTQKHIYLLNSTTSVCFKYQTKTKAWKMP